MDAKQLWGVLKQKQDEVKAFYNKARLAPYNLTNKRETEAWDLANQFNIPDAPGQDVGRPDVLAPPEQKEVYTPVDLWQSILKGTNQGIKASGNNPLNIGATAGFDNLLTQNPSIKRLILNPQDRDLPAQLQAIYKMSPSEKGIYREQVDQTIPKSNFGNIPVVSGIANSIGDTLGQGVGGAAKLTAARNPQEGISDVASIALAAGLGAGGLHAGMGGLGAVGQPTSLPTRVPSLEALKTGAKTGGKYWATIGGLYGAKKGEKDKTVQDQLIKVLAGIFSGGAFGAATAGLGNVAVNQFLPKTPPVRMVDVKSIRGLENVLTKNPPQHVSTAVNKAQQAVLDKYKALSGTDMSNPEAALAKFSGFSDANTKATFDYAMLTKDIPKIQSMWSTIPNSYKEKFGQQVLSIIQGK